MMKVLFASATHCDWITSTLYQGLCGVLGTENVYDATGGNRDLPGSPCVTQNMMERPDGPELNFDVLVLNSVFLCEHGWSWPVGHLGQETMGHPFSRLKADSKIIYVEGWDGASEYYKPPFPVDAVFRREIDPGVKYPYSCQSVDFGLPERLFDTGGHERPYDFACLFNCKGMAARQCVLAKARTLAKHYQAHVGEGWTHPPYLEALRESKLALCVMGAADCGDCMRNAEVVAMGAIPVFVQHPARLKDPWYDHNEAFWCPNVDDLPSVIEKALASDLVLKRKKMQLRALRLHSAEGQACRILRSVGRFP